MSKEVIYAIKNKYTDKYLNRTHISQQIFESNDPLQFTNKEIALKRIETFYKNYNCELIEI